MSEVNPFEAWKTEIRTATEAALQNPTIPDDVKEVLAFDTSIYLDTAESTHRLLIAARAIGASVLPKGTTADVIQIASLMYTIETDKIAALEEEEPGNDEPPSAPPPNREQRRHPQQQQQRGHQGR